MSFRIKNHFIPIQDLCKQRLHNYLVSQLRKSSSLLDNFETHKKSSFFLLISALVILVFQNEVHASWYDQKLEGWYYFEDKDSVSSEKKLPLTPEEAEEFILLEKRKLQQLLSLAILSPTSENVANYIRAQLRTLDQSGAFAQTWGKVLLEHPELGDFLATPTTSYGILAKKAYDSKQRAELLRKLSENYFLIFFFNGRDPFAPKVAEVVQAFASTNGWKYKAVSLDGIGLPQFQSFETDKGISHNFGVKVSPSLYIVNPADNQAYPVGAGLVSVSEIESNIEIHLGERHE